jgi:D-sedoheptulose 7-phosphate isomerase
VAAAAEILENLVSRRPELASCAGDLAAAADALTLCFRRGCKLLICGNGGSAADCDHISAELLKGFRSRRQLESPGKLSKFHGHIQGALPAIPLPNFTALLTAFANDCSHDYDFAQLVHALGKSGDLLLAISTSGNSDNVLNACELAREMGLTVLGLGGRDGGKMFQLCDICVRVPAQETYLVQELHLPVYHALCAMVEADIFGE